MIVTFCIPKVIFRTANSKDEQFVIPEFLGTGNHPRCVHFLFFDWQQQLASHPITV
jgi:hypothetical protein